jgi:peptidylprolyl isomerase
MAAFAGEEEIKLPSGTTYVIMKKGDGPEPKVGELAGIRFRALVLQSGQKIDDIFDSPEPYYTRVGSGGLLKGVEEVLPLMRMGDRYFITVPTNMAFGPKGRPSSAGKPRIPGDAIITFEVEMVSMPGREQELIDLIGDE